MCRHPVQYAALGARCSTSDHSPGGSKTKLFHIEFSDFHVSKEDSIKPRCYQLQGQLFEAEYLADEDSVSVPADVAAIIHPSQKETLRVRELQRLAWYRRAYRLPHHQQCWICRPSTGDPLSVVEASFCQQARARHGGQSGDLFDDGDPLSAIERNTHKPRTLHIVGMECCRSRFHRLFRRIRIETTNNRRAPVVSEKWRTA
jgi:hypothetical protein